MCKKILSSIGILVCCIYVMHGVAFAAPSFFEGKTVRVVVGLSAGGGYDLYARMIGRHLGRNIPGNPTVIVDNMPGAGSMIAANYFFKAVKPDGLTIGHVSGNIILNQILDRPGAEFDARKFEYIGAPYQDDMVVLVTKASGITNMEKWINSKRPIKFGGEAPGTTFSDNIPRVLRVALGLPIKPVSGYKGTAEVKLAMESGEVDGNCASWESAKALWRKQLESGDIIPVLQCVAKPVPEIANVPLAISYAKTDEARKLIEVAMHEPSVYARPFFVPPGTPKDRVQILRHAFEATLKDKDFLAELQQAKMALKPATGELLTSVIQGLFDLDPAMKAKLKDILYK